MVGVLAVAGYPRFALHLRMRVGCSVRFHLQVVDGALCLWVVLARTQRHLQFEVLAGAAWVCLKKTCA